MADGERERERESERERARTFDTLGGRNEGSFVTG